MAIRTGIRTRTRGVLEAVSAVATSLGTARIPAMSTSWGTASVALLFPPFLGPEADHCAMVRGRFVIISIWFIRPIRRASPRTPRVRQSAHNVCRYAPDVRVNHGELSERPHSHLPEFPRRSSGARSRPPSWSRAWSFRCGRRSLRRSGCLHCRRSGSGIGCACRRPALRQ